MLHFACSTKYFPLTLTLSLRERDCLGSGRASSVHSEPVPAVSRFPLPARSGERIKVRGDSRCVVTAWTSGID